MKYVPIVAMSVVAGCVSRPVTIPAAHAAVNPFQSSASPNYWRPSEEDIAALEADMGRLWVKPDKRMSERVKLPLSDYFVRYHGAMVDGKRFIFGDGVHREEPRAKDYLVVESENTKDSTIFLTAFGCGTGCFPGDARSARKRA